MSLDVNEVRSRILAAMSEKGMSRRMLSERAGLGESAVRDLLTRTENPGVATLARICEALDLSLADLLS
mgnify:FL=1|jgi:DNA-binding Xre family transcriptional regulator